MFLLFWWSLWMHPAIHRRDSLQYNFITFDFPKKWPFCPHWLLDDVLSEWEVQHLLGFNYKNRSYLATILHWNIHLWRTVVLKLAKTSLYQLAWHKTISFGMPSLTSSFQLKNAIILATFSSVDSANACYIHRSNHSPCTGSWKSTFRTGPHPFHIVAFFRSQNRLCYHICTISVLVGDKRCNLSFCLHNHTPQK